MFSNQENKVAYIAQPSEVSLLPLTAKKLTKEEVRLHTKHLTYLLPGTFKSLPPPNPMLKNKKGKGKGKGSKSSKDGEGLYFPSPAKASRLNKIYHIFQEYSGGAAASSTTIEATGALNVQYSSNSQEAQLTAVFDQYRVAMIEVTFMPRVNLSTFSNTPPVFYSVVDLDDSATTGILSLQNYPGVQVTEAYAKHVHTFVPHVAVAVYSGAFTSFANERAPWIDVASPNVQHYGIKWGFSQTTQVYTYDIKVRVHYQFKNVR